MKKLRTICILLAVTASSCLADGKVVITEHLDLAYDHDTLSADMPLIFLTAGSFENNARIPRKYTCEGEDISPGLSWEIDLQNIKSFALICDDPDAPGGTWVHWVIYNIPPLARSIGEAIPAVPQLEDGSLQGRNDFQRIGYGGPCPPPGKPHRYFFKIYGLDIVLPLPAGGKKMDLVRAFEDHVIAAGTLIGTYKR